MVDCEDVKWWTVRMSVLLSFFPLLCPGLRVQMSLYRSLCCRVGSDVVRTSGDGV